MSNVHPALYSSVCPLYSTAQRPAVSRWSRNWTPRLPRVTLWARRRDRKLISCHVSRSRVLINRFCFKGSAPTMFRRTTLEHLKICLSLCLFICLSLYLPLCLSIYLPIWLSVCLFICLSVSLSVHLSATSASLSVHLSAASASLSSYLSICLSIWQCLSISLSSRPSIYCLILPSLACPALHKRCSAASGY